MTAAENLQAEFHDESLDELDLDIIVSNEEVSVTQQKLMGGWVHLKDVAGLTREEMEALYAKGIEQLSIGMCAEAGRIFFSLVMLERTNARYIRAVGLAYHYQRKHRWARVVYGQALVYDPTDVIAMALRAECTLLLIGKREAVKELEQCLAMPIRDRHDLPYVERAKALLAKLSIYQGDIK